MNKLASDITKTSMDTDLQFTHTYKATLTHTHTHTHTRTHIYIYYYITSMKKFVVSLQISSEGSKEEIQAEVR